MIFDFKSWEDFFEKENYWFGWDIIVLIVAIVAIGDYSFNSGYRDYRYYGYLKDDRQCLVVAFHSEIVCCEFDDSKSVSDKNDR